MKEGYIEIFTGGYSMAIEFTCLSCTRTFSIPVADLLREDYLACIGCGRPVPAELLNALKRVGQALC
jgi:hypothetical protein